MQTNEEFEQSLLNESIASQAQQPGILDELAGMSSLEQAQIGISSGQAIAGLANLNASRKTDDALRRNKFDSVSDSIGRLLETSKRQTAQRSNRKRSNNVQDLASSLAFLSGLSGSKGGRTSIISEDQLRSALNRR